MIRNLLVSKTVEAVSTLYGKAVAPATVQLEKTRRDFEGDFTVVVFPLTSYSGDSPENTATAIGEYLMKEIKDIRSFRTVKGFLNLSMSARFWISFLQKNYPDAGYGMGKKKNEKPVVLEYSSPNTNKPLHLGHIRNNLLGYALAEILKANGYRVIRVNLVNDRGIHISKSMLAYRKWGKGETPASSGLKPDHLIGKYYVLFETHYREEIRDLMEKGQSEEEASRNASLIREAQELLRKWESKDRDTMELWHTMNSWAYEGFDETYRRLGVEFDNVQHESETYIYGKAIVEEGVEKGLLTRKADGSVWAEQVEKDAEPKLLLRADGTSVYMTQDLGTAQLRWETFTPSRMIYVVGNEQNYHFDILKKILERLGKECAGHIFHLSYGMVELPHGRMKSREGTVVDADDLMDEMYRTAEKTTRELGKMEGFTDEEAGNLFHVIGMGALKYFILKVDPRKNMLFDPQESIDFNGNTGPFIQYTYARIRSLLRRAVETGIIEGEPFDMDLSGLGKEMILREPEREILRILYEFPDIVDEAGNELSPALVANYVYELAKEYNQFYQEIPVLKEPDPAVVRYRLALSFMTGTVIGRSMQLLGIAVPARM